MHISKQSAVILLAGILMAIGCSQGEAVVAPAVDASREVISSESSNHQLLGLYTFACDPASGAVDAVPLRESELHLNALTLLEPPPLVLLTIEGKPIFNGNILDVNIGLRNPYIALNQYTGFDVCGIVFTHGSLSGFADPDIVMAGAGDTRLLNADGYTRWWNPSEFPHGDTIFNYTNGLLGTPAENADFNCTINGYKYFADGLGKDDPLSVLGPADRGVFSVGMKNVRHYKIDLSGGLIFNYAVDACWKKPTGTPPYQVPDDFPPDANRPEAWNMRVTEVENNLFCDDVPGLRGGELKIIVEIWDHFNAGENEVYAESLAGLPLTQALNPVGGGEGFSTYELDFTGVNLTRNGDAELNIAVQSGLSGYGGLLPGKSQCVYFQHKFNIRKPLGWARTWGGESGARCEGVATDDAGNIYVTGDFDDVVDFDPGPGVDLQGATDGVYIYLSKFAGDGQFLWARSWGSTGPTQNRGCGVTADDFGNAYVTGCFRGTIDFDPGPGVDEHEGSGVGEIFLSKFNPDGDFQWARTWGGINGFFEGDGGNAVSTDGSNSIYVTGGFGGNSDFDPGPDVDQHISNGNGDTFLSKFDMAGQFQWARTWGGSGSETGWGVDVDDLGNAYVTGDFWDKVDFDPGPGVDEHTSNGDYDIFLSKFDSNGVYEWGRTWGSPHDDYFAEDYGYAVASDSSGGEYVTGGFGGIVDFDPGPGIDEHISTGETDSFVSKFDTDGVFKWARTWGGKEDDYGLAVAPASTGDISISGCFSELVDFDPGPGSCLYLSYGKYDVYLSKFDTDGEFQWSRAWGGLADDIGQHIAVDGYGNSFINGDFGGTVDFDPGPGVDEHMADGYKDAFLSKFPPDGNW